MVIESDEAEGEDVQGTGRMAIHCGVPETGRVATIPFELGSSTSTWPRPLPTLESRAIGSNGDRRKAPQKNTGKVMHRYHQLVGNL